VGQNFTLSLHTQNRAKDCSQKKKSTFIIAISKILIGQDNFRKKHIVLVRVHFIKSRLFLTQQFIRQKIIRLS